MKHVIADRKLKNRAIAAAALGTFMIGCVAVGYFGEYGRFYEMTFLSNILTGFVLVAGAIKIALTGRDIPHVLYLDCAALLLTVVGVCLFFAPGATMLSPSVVLHLVNPLSVSAFYLSFCDGRDCRAPLAFTSLVFPFMYYFFMIGFGKVTGDCIYPYFDPNRLSALTLFLVALLATVLVSAIAFSLLSLNRHLRVRRERKATIARSENA